MPVYDARASAASAFMSTAMEGNACLREFINPSAKQQQASPSHHPGGLNAHSSRHLWISAIVSDALHSKDVTRLGDLPARIASIASARYLFSHRGAGDG